MNTIIGSLNAVSEPFARFIGPMLWQSSLLILVLFALDLALRRKVRAAVRYALWLVVLVKLVVPPTLSLPTSIAWWLRPVATLERPAPTHVIVIKNDLPGIAGPVSTAPTISAIKPTLTPASYVLLTFASGSVILFGWMLLRWRQVTQLERNAAPANEALATLLHQTQRELGIRHAVNLRITAEPISPALCGLIHPTILLPQSLIDHLPENQLRAVLLHELTHLKRGDGWMNFIQTLLQIGYWWHPLLWMANARIRRVREEAVDDAVMVALQDESETYAPTLLEVARLNFVRPLVSLGLVGILESRSTLRRRIEHLLNFKLPRKSGLSLISLFGVIAFTATALPMGEGPARITRTDAKVIKENTVFSAKPITYKQNNKQLVADGSVIVEMPISTASTHPVQLLAKNEAQSPQTSSSAIITEKFFGFDSETKEQTVATGIEETKFLFSLTNISHSDVVITSVVASCGCTVAKLPVSPWRLAPNESGQIPVTMNLRGRTGSMHKSITVLSDHGNNTLYLNVNFSSTTEKASVPEHTTATPPPAPQILIETKFIELPNFDPDAEPNDSPLHNLPKVNSTTAATTNEPSRLVTEFKARFGEHNNLTLEAVAPSTITQLLTADQAAALMKRLNESNADLLNAPSVQTLDNRQAKVQIADIKTIVTGYETNSTVDAKGKPQLGINYLTKEIPFGAELDVDPQLDSRDTNKINLTILANVTEFIGYDDPGKFSISVTAPGAKPLSGVLPLPRARVRELTTATSLQSGQSILLAGPVTQTIHRVKDKVPVLGSIPLLGSFFRSEKSSTVNTHLLILIKARLVNDEGEPIQQANRR